ncbi:MAG TPA: hypothetical protein PLL19_01815 [Thiobacillaceae bacterium]|nr:hypothetical protein [Thiobacillaceae bacterium]HNF88037.1 hypothetical protein [Thiobacillaceae bacterium]HNH87978.1 hypothetical protein [Thiobacillaceae bacterium]HNI07065.1 hypothetical protein [Thiobacillaceae bacterium]
MIFGMEPEVVAAFIGIGGISLGALFSGLGYLIRSRSDQRKIKSRVLFYLLEIRFALATQMLDPGSLKEQYLAYIDELLKKKGLAGEGGIEQLLEAAISNHFSEIVSVAKVPIDEKLVSAYEASLQELSLYAPIRAYQLKGQELAGKLVDCQERYLESILSLEAFQPNEELGDFMPKKLHALNEKALTELLSSIESEIHGLAASIGAFTFIRSYIATRKKPLSNPDFSKMGIEQPLDEFFEGVMQQQTRQSSRSPEGAARTSA